MSRLVLGRDQGGERWHLDGRPVHCGAGLELRLPGDRWEPVRFELAFDGNQLAPVLHLALGHPWERRFEASRCEGAAWCVFDARRGVRCRVEDREDTPDDPEGRLVYPDLAADEFSTRGAAEVAADGLNHALAGCPEAVLLGAEKAELRWPRSRR